MAASYQTAALARTRAPRYNDLMGTRTVKGLGEIALRVEDLDRMQAFYEQVVGLKLLRRFERAAFFEVAPGHGGHTQVLALFDRGGAPRGAGPGHGALDHLAFAIDAADYASEKARLEGLGLAVSTAEHAWVGWRSLYVDDPEGNRVEWVCYDEAVR